MFHVFDNAKQTRQFWVITGCAIIFAIGLGNIFEAKGALHIFTDATMIILTGIMLVLSLKEINDEKLNNKQNPKEVSS